MPSSEIPWTCVTCSKAIPDLDGFFEVVNANRKLGPVGAYPIQATPDEWSHPQAAEGRVVDAAEGFAAVIAELERGHNISFRAYHRACTPDPDQQGYWVRLREVATLEQYLAWVLHLREKTWMGREDLMRMLLYWFQSRKVSPEDYAAARAPYA